MFDKEYEFKGKHAKYVRALCTAEGKFNKIFPTFVDLYMAAPVVGVVYRRMAEIDNSKEKVASIFAEQFNPRREELKFIYKLVMLTDDKKMTSEDRINRAFKVTEDDVDFIANFAKFNKYVLGGVEVLYEKIYQDVKEPEDLFNNFQKFLTDFNTSFLTEEKIELDLFDEIEVG
jgi:hypothetical protein